MQHPPRREWTDDEVDALEDHDGWDLDTVFEHPPVEDPHAQVPIRLTTQQLGLIERAARLNGTTITNFIVSVAVEQATSQLQDKHNPEAAQHDD